MLQVIVFIYNSQLDTIYNDVLNQVYPHSDGNKCVILTDYSHINTLTFLLLDDRFVIIFIKLCSVHYLPSFLNITVTSLQGFQMLR